MDRLRLGVRSEPFCSTAYLAQQESWFFHRFHRPTHPRGGPPRGLLFGL